MIDQLRIETELAAHGFDEFRWIAGKDIQVRQWVRFKCAYGCDSYGRKGGCPPEVPTIPECREFFGEYAQVVVIRLQAQFPDPDERKAWSRQLNQQLLKLERAVFLAGYHKAFQLFIDECGFCADCSGERRSCNHPTLLRPSAEALGIDVFATVRSCGFPIEVLTDLQASMNRYAFLLIG